MGWRDALVDLFLLVLLLCVMAAAVMGTVWLGIRLFG